MNDKNTNGRSVQDRSIASPAEGIEGGIYSGQSVFFYAAEWLPQDKMRALAAAYPRTALKKIFADAEMMRTVQCFIDCNLNVSAAARELYMHRNTMIYRLNKIKKITSLDIREFGNAAIFELLYAAYIKETKE